MNLLGIDWGKSKVGIALGSDETRIASPIEILTFKNVGDLKEQLGELINSENIDQLVLGKPISLSGESGVSEAYKKFVTLLEGFELPINFEDERLSTKYAASLKKEFNNKKKVGDDDVAAAAILQTYLDRL